MTVDSATYRNDHVGTASTDTYSYAFRIQREEDLLVTKLVSGTSAPVTLVLNTDYTVTGVGNANGGTIVLSAGNLPTGDTLTIRQNPALLQEDRYRGQSDFRGENHENTYDRTVKQIQGLKDEVERSLKYPEGDTAASVLPIESIRASQVLGFDANGEPIAVTAASVGATNIAAYSHIGNNSSGTAPTAVVAYDDTQVLADGSTTRRDLSDRFADVVNVKDWGAVGDGVTDDAAAINAALAAVPTYGTVYFPAGTYLCQSQVTTNRAIQFSILGAGANASRLLTDVDTDGSFYFTGQDRISINGMRFGTSGTFTQGNYLLHIESCIDAMISDTFLEGVRGLLKVDTCNFLTMTNVRGESVTGTGGGTCLRLIATGGTVSNCYFRVGPFATGGYQDAAPCFHVTGQSTSLKVSNCGFVGGGPWGSWAISSISSTASDFTVTTSVNHGFAAGDHVAIRGASVAAYNQSFRIASVTATTFVVNSTLNPGAATAQGTAETPSVCMLVSNADGAVNESQVNNCLFEAGQPNQYGTVAVMLDGNRATNQLSGWLFNDCYADYGYSGVVMIGKDGGGGVVTLGNISIQGFKAENNSHAVIVEGSRNVNISGMIGQSNQNSATDYLGDVGPRSSDIVLVAGQTPYARGITITGCNIGMDLAWTAGTAARQKDLGIYLIGGGNAIDDVTIFGNQVFGKTFAVGYDASTVIGVGWNYKDNSQAFGTVGTNYIPTVASAGTLNIYPFHDYQEVTGTTNIQFINPGFIGRELTLLFQGGLTLLTGGNLAIAANYAVLAGQLVTLVHNGTSWYLK